MRKRQAVNTAGQIDVGEQYVNGCGGELPQRFRRIAHRANGKPLLGERLGDPFADQKFIFDQQDAERRKFT
jgi:hypothetical protein